MVKFLSNPQCLKGFFRYRWMQNYLATPDFIDRHTEGLRGPQLRVAHKEFDFIVTHVCDTMKSLFEADQRIGGDPEKSKKMVILDENMGPLGGLVIKKFDELVDGKIAAGFEMLVGNFSAGILGGILAILGYLAIGPVAEAVNNAMGAGVGWLVDRGLLPLTSILVEPAKVLFLNNAINHGVFTPLGAEQAATVGRSIFFMWTPSSTRPTARFWAAAGWMAPSTAARAQSF